MKIIAKSLDNGRQVDVIYLNFSKAFDSISNDLLLLKLQSFGVNFKFLNLFRNYLSDRRQRVVLNGPAFEYLNALSGVQQASFWSHFCFCYISITLEII